MSHSHKGPFSHTKMITPYNILRHELLGMEVEAEAGGSSIKGVVSGETSKTFKIKTPKGVKTIIKETSSLVFRLPGDSVVRVEGRLLSGRPEDRIKKRHRIRF